MSVIKMIQNQQIAAGILAGDEKVMKAFYKKNLPYVRKFIITRSGCMEDVEDVFQDALILLYHKLGNGSLELHASINTYFIGICKNKWYMQMRKAQKVDYSDTVITDTIDNQASIIESITKQDQDQLYNKHLSGLSESNKTFLELFFDGHSMREIASITGYSEGYTRKKKFEIKQYLTKMIQREPEYGELAV